MQIAVQELKQNTGLNANCFMSTPLTITPMNPGLPQQNTGPLISLAQAQAFWEMSGDPCLLSLSKPVS